MEPISRIDPSVNQLYFRGYNATELAKTLSFESVLYLLVHGNLPSEKQTADLMKRMIELRGLYRNEMKTLEDMIIGLSEFDLGLYDSLLAYVTLCPMVIANEFAKTQGKKAEPPNNELDHVANFLWMSCREIPSQLDWEDFRTFLILPMDDPINPSLTALCTKLKQGSVSDALLAALQAHVGPLHHGAGTLAIDMFEDIRKSNNTRQYLEERLISGEKIYGLGHRIYRGIDPRAVVLREMLERRSKGTKAEWLMRVSEEVVAEGKLLLAARKGIQAYPNIDLYNAAVSFTFGFPPELNTSLFAISRSAGWVAHIWEFTNKKTFLKG